MSWQETTRQILTRNQLRIFAWLLGLWFIILLGLMIFRAGGGHYFLKHEDEAIYYCSAKLFAQTGSVQAEGCNLEEVSPIGKINWYGPGFHVAYGIWFKIFGVTPSVFPWFHFFLAIGSLALISLMKINRVDRLAIIVGMALSHQFFYYVFTFFPETLIVFFATVLSVLLFAMAYPGDAKAERNASLLYIVCCLFFSLCRITMIFWLIGWVALGRSRSTILLRAIVFAFVMAGTLVYMKLFLAPTFAPSVQKVNLLFEGQVWDFIVATLSSMWQNASEMLMSPSIPTYYLLALLAGTTVAAFRTRDRFAIAAASICYILLLVFMALYVVNSFFFVKQTAMMLPLVVTAIVVGFRSITANYAVVVLALALFPRSFIATRKIINERRNQYEMRVAFQDLERAFGEIPKHIQSQSSIVLWCYNEYDFGTAAESLLTFATVGGNPILYTTNVVDPASSPEEKFQLHHKLKVDYILSRSPLSRPDVEEIHRTRFYYLYRLRG